MPASAAEIASACQVLVGSRTISGMSFVQFLVKSHEGQAKKRRAQRQQWSEEALQQT